ncbi:tocopherol cyclase family protein [Alkaliphilus peptidifermentans]|uniref:Tocopherol cyclase n=1 Tax=Alkaliphilus peptidifermentans DSM 18978 TaxID=1120976 RepID=A0A1G5EY88_9FIRM|nr:tocopherol cyclase family protein [Alkaliphilus peptidifermentans]SCY31894.1 Tocopherol cyclase [Alkaliphilus peptidifermentans DSM 18978]
MYILTKLWNPEMFQGRYKKKNYFEGWYFKLINDKRDTVLGVIPGISLEADSKNSHSFIQVFDGIEGEVDYFSFPIDDFHSSNKNFVVQIGDNYFNSSKIKLDLENNNTKIQGTLSFYNIVPFPKSIIYPGIMGPFSYLPFMECYHGIVNIHHNIKGALTINHENISFDKGYGYIEKDWGVSFPEAYIWLQSNHFAQENISVMFSIAKIPWLRKHFIGHISFLKIGDNFFRFATYTGAKIKRLKKYANGIEAIIEDRHHRLEISATFSKSSILIAPQKGVMNREILESITSQVHVKLSDKSNNIIFQGEGKNTGLEMVGDLSVLLPKS